MLATTLEYCSYEANVFVQRFPLKFSLVVECTLRYKFDDERVTKEDIKRALEEQYGGEEEVNAFIQNTLNILISLLLTLLPRSFLRLILDLIMLLSNLQSTQMLICLCIFEIVIKKR